MFGIIPSFMTLIAIAWAALYFTGSALLISSDKVKNNLLQETLECRYFTGIGFKTQKHTILINGLVGIKNCPRVIKLDMKGE